MDLVKALSSQYMKAELPEMRVGDTVRVHVRIKEGARERIQVFEGTIIARKHGGNAVKCLCKRQDACVLQIGDDDRCKAVGEIVFRDEDQVFRGEGTFVLVRDLRMRIEIAELGDPAEFKPRAGKGLMQFCGKGGLARSRCAAEDV